MYVHSISEHKLQIKRNQMRWYVVPKSTSKFIAFIKKYINFNLKGLVLQPLQKCIRQPSSANIIKRRFHIQWV